MSYTIESSTIGSASLNETQTFAQRKERCGARGFVVRKSDAKHPLWEREMIVGYARVSTDGQTLDAQEAALAAAGARLTSIKKANRVLKSQLLKPQ